MSRRPSGFTMIEVLVAMAVFSLFAAALLATWAMLQTAAVNTTTYAQRQNDQMRVLDYVKRDIRRATTVEIYNGASLVAGTAFGSELRLTVPDYYADSREEDNTSGANTINTPALSGTTVAYGSSITVRYYASNGAMMREEAGTARKLSEAVGAFTLSFSKETSGQIRTRMVFNQRLRSGTNRMLQRQIDALCGQRSQLQL